MQRILSFNISDVTVFSFGNNYTVHWNLVIKYTLGLGGDVRYMMSLHLGFSLMESVGIVSGVQSTAIRQVKRNAHGARSPEVLPESDSGWISISGCKQQWKLAEWWSKTGCISSTGKDLWWHAVGTCRVNILLLPSCMIQVWSRATWWIANNLFLANLPGEFFGYSHFVRYAE